MANGTPRNTLIWALCCDARSGSTWFSDLIASTGVLGRPAEYLLDLPQEYAREKLPADTPVERYLDLLLARKSTANGVFAIKGNLDPLRPFFQRFGNVPCVWLRRQDTLEQAISWYRAEKGGSWTRLDGQGPAAAPPFDRDAIQEYLQALALRELAWKAWFTERNIVPLALTYEEICFNPLAAVRVVARHIGVAEDEIRQVHSPLRIVRDDVTQRWIDLLRQRL